MLYNINIQIIEKKHQNGLYCVMMDVLLLYMVGIGCKKGCLPFLEGLEIH